MHNGTRLAHGRIHGGFWKEGVSESETLNLQSSTFLITVESFRDKIVEETETYYKSKLNVMQWVVKLLPDCGWNQSTWSSMSVTSSSSPFTKVEESYFCKTTYIYWRKPLRHIFGQYAVARDFYNVLNGQFMRNVLQSETFRDKITEETAIYKKQIA